MMKAGSMMVSRQASKIVRRYCDCCGDELDAHQALSSGVCNRQRCREWKIEQVGAALLERRRREILERLFEEQAGPVGEAARAIGATADTVARGTVPWQGHPVTPLPDERRTEFEAHIRWLVEEAFLDLAPTEEAGDERARMELEESPLLVAACALCRGKCCERGDTTALLDEADIARWRGRDPDATPDGIVAAYMAALPSETVEGACVFLAATGCALPRAMRSDWCNSYQCKERENLQAAVGDSGGDAVVVIADNAETESAGGIFGWSPVTGAIPVPARPAPAGPDDGRGGTA